MKKVLKWILFILLGLVLFAVIAGVLMVGWRFGFGGIREGYGMVNHMRGFGSISPVGMIFGGLLRLGLFLLVVVGIVGLVYSLTRGRQSTQVTPSATPAIPSRTCASCGKPAQDDWTTCPYCGNSLA
jgi:flagellar biosynthesis protein FlhB